MTNLTSLLHKVIFFASLIPALLFFEFSCSKKNNLIDQEINVQKINEISQMKDLVAQKISYVEHLNPAEKLVIWNKKFDLLSNRLSTLNTNQKQIISELRTHLTQDVFRTAASRDKFMKDFGNSWTYRAENIFSREQVIRFFTSISMDNDHLKLISSAVQPDVVQPNCQCSVVSDYCPQYQYCLDWNCEQSSFGCGFLGLFICEGRCKYNIQ
jgi:hypothetical protein